jgi:hypothetical protein
MMVAIGPATPAVAAHSKIPGWAPARLQSAMADNSMKSSFELAMERLRKKDVEDGVVTRPLSDAERAAIAEVRNFYDAKIAEQEVLHQAAMRGSVDPAERDVLDQQYRRDRERFTSERDNKVEKIRRGETP